VVSVPAASYLGPGSVRRACAARAGATLPDNAVGLGASSAWHHRLHLASVARTHNRAARVHNIAAMLGSARLAL
jgi:hypothetical protein